jgi:hypothetical protein
MKSSLFGYAGSAFRCVGADGVRRALDRRRRALEHTRESGTHARGGEQRSRTRMETDSFTAYGRSPLLLPFSFIYACSIHEPEALHPHHNAVTARCALIFGTPV